MEAESFPALDLIPEPGDVVDDRRQPVEGELGFEGPFEERGLVHAVDDRGGLVLAQGESSGSENGLAALDAVAAHAGHHDADGGGLVDPGGRLEEYVDRRLVAAHGWIIGKRYPNARGVPDQHHVPAAGSDQNLVRQDGVAVTCFLDRKRRAAVEALGEDSGKLRGHVLHDQDRWNRRL